jgi:hypothetical protein
MSAIRIHQTGQPDSLEASDGRLTLSIPIQIRRRSGRGYGARRDDDNSRPRKR